MINGVAFFNPSTGLLVSMPAPNRHSDIVRVLYGETQKQVNSIWIQGFITQDGKFLDRKEAARYVTAFGQSLTERARASYINRTLTTLFSEDLW